MSRRSERVPKLNEKGIKYREEVETLQTKAKTRRKEQNMRRESKGMRPLAVIEEPVKRDSEDITIGITKAMGALSLGRGRKNRKSRKTRRARK